MTSSVWESVIRRSAGSAAIARGAGLERDGVDSNSVMGFNLAVRRARTLLVAVLFVSPCLGAGSPAAQQQSPPSSRWLQSLSVRLATVLDGRALRGARVAALVVDEASGTVLFERDAEQPLVPASNQKVLTALAALAGFGPAHRFKTDVLSTAPIDGQGRVPELIVRGGGDPALTSEEFWRIAADLRRIGLREVRGDLLLDDSAFDGERWNPAWGPPESRAYYAPVSALSVNYGAFAVEVRPGPSRGAAAFAAIDPPVPYLILHNTATTGPSANLTIARAPAAVGERVVVGGSVNAAQLYYRSVGDGVRYAGAVLRWQLEANGIAVLGSERVAAVPAGAVTLLEHEGLPLAEVMRRLMKFSNNHIAEMLVKAMGRAATGSPGGWENGMTTVRERLRELGVDLGPARLLDGSGLARGNRVSPRVLVDALRVGARSFEFGPEFVGALPLSGADGTLAKRNAGPPRTLRAKTGLLNGITGLSGYARRGDGSRAVFSVLANGYRCSDAEAMAAMDEFARALTE